MESTLGAKGSFTVQLYPEKKKKKGLSAVLLSCLLDYAMRSGTSDNKSAY